MKTFWLTKYALSTGIEKVTTSGANTEKGSHVRVSGRAWGLYKVGTDLQSTREEAVAVAEQMRQKKVASVKKQLAKLEKMNFAEGGAA
jgi:hypothetical protein